MSKFSVSGAFRITFWGLFLDGPDRPSWCLLRRYYYSSQSLFRSLVKERVIGVDAGLQVVAFRSGWSPLSPSEMLVQPEVWLSQSCRQRIPAAASEFHLRRLIGSLRFSNVTDLPVFSGWMNEWMSEWIPLSLKCHRPTSFLWFNEWINEWINKWMNEWMDLSVPQMSQTYQFSQVITRQL